LCEELWIDRYAERWRVDSWGVTGPPNKSTLWLHEKLQKPESSVLIQLRTGKTGTARFLHKRGVPSYNTPLCRCRRGIGTPAHLLLRCKIYQSSRHLLGRPGLSFRELVSDKAQVASTVEWVIRTGELRQFDLAGELLYNWRREPRGRERAGEG
jgi:hypothetical protein